MKQLFIYLFLTIFLTQDHEYSNEYFVIWSKNRPITFEDFKKFESENSNNLSYLDAYLNYEIAFFPKVLTLKEIDDIVVIPIMHKNESFMKIKNVELLRHEQLHFDIAEYYSRLIRQKIHVERFDEGFNLKKLKSLYDDLVTECSIMQNEYDEDTMHSMDKEQQKIWEIKIHDLLNSLTKFECDIKMKDIQ